MSALALFAAAASAATASLVVRRLLPPDPSLRELIAVPAAEVAPDDVGLRDRAAGLLLRLAPGLRGEQTARRLRQAGLVGGEGAEAALQAHIRRLLGGAWVTAAAVGTAGLVAGLPRGLLPALVVLGACGGAARAHADLDRRVERRRERLALELATVNQLLTLDVRTGGGVAQALRRIGERGRGVAAEEVRAVLAAARGGLPLDDALELAARTTPAPAAARTYRLLAKGSRYGADLAAGLRALNDDLRQERTAAVERAATRRRAAMLVPIIALLAPVMLLFVAAPLPSIVLGHR